MYKTVADVFESESPPVVVATVNMTQDAHGQVVRPGSILFPRGSKKSLKTKLKGLMKKGEMGNAEFTTTMGTKVHLSMDCDAGFSTQANDVKLYLSELMDRLTLPLEVKCFAHQQSRHCKNMSNITLTETKEETSITGGLTLEGDSVKDQLFELSLDLPVQVSCINLTKKDLQEDLYSRVKSTYESVDHRLATNWKVVVNGDACDKAQQEFYASIRTDMAQDVVTVDLPERIYEELDFGIATTVTSYKGVQHQRSAGVPKPAPPLPRHSLDGGKDESYMQLMHKADSSRTTPSPLPHSSFEGSANVHSKTKQPILRHPPPVLPGKPPAIYAELQPNTSPANTYASLVPDRPAPPKTSPKQPSKPAMLKAPNAQPQPTVSKLPPAPAPKPAVLNKPTTQPQLRVSQTAAEGSNPGPVNEDDNVKYLQTLNCNDIIRLIEAMELRQYIDCFMKVSKIVSTCTMHMCLLLGIITA